MKEWLTMMVSADDGIVELIIKLIILGFIVSVAFMVVILILRGITEYFIYNKWLFVNKNENRTTFKRVIYGIHGFVNRGVNIISYFDNFNSNFIGIAHIRFELIKGILGPFLWLAVSSTIVLSTTNSLSEDINIGLKTWPGFLDRIGLPFLFWLFISFPAFKLAYIHISNYQVEKNDYLLSSQTSNEEIAISSLNGPQDRNKDQNETPIERRLRIQKLYADHGIKSTINTSLEGQSSVTFVQAVPQPINVDDKLPESKESETGHEKRLRMQALLRSKGIKSEIDNSREGQTSITFVRSAPIEQTDDAEASLRYLNRKKNS